MGCVLNKRYKSEIALSKPEKVNLMSEYIGYYEGLINEQGLNALNVKIPRDVFVNIFDEIGIILNKRSLEKANEDGPVKNFLEENPLPPHMKELLSENAELHQPLRDGRPPILLSKKGHNLC